MGAVGSENTLFKGGVVEFPLVPKLGGFVPDFMIGVVSGKCIFPAGDVATSSGVTVAFGVSLLLSPPGQVLGHQGLLG